MERMNDKCYEGPMLTWSRANDKISYQVNLDDTYIPDISKIKSVEVHKVTPYDLEMFYAKKTGAEEFEEKKKSFMSNHRSELQKSNLQIKESNYGKKRFSDEDLLEIQFLNDYLIEYRTQKNKNKKDIDLFNKLEKVINKYTYEIAARLPAPIISKCDLPIYDHDENPKKWIFKRKGSHELILKKVDSICEGTVEWIFEIKYDSENGAREKVTHDIELSEIMNALYSLLTLKKSDFKKAKGFFGELVSAAVECTFSLAVPSLADDEAVDFYTGKSNEYHSKLSGNYVNHTYEEIQSDIKPIYDEYAKSQKQIKDKKEFFDKYATKHTLFLMLKDYTAQMYLEDFCGFDIFEKEIYINNELLKQQQYRQKLENSNNAGEKTVEYALEWFIKANHDKHIVEIKGDCESRHRLDCILLNKPDFIDDPQEYDHILVCSGGIVIIETKHWKGTVEIRKDGQWIRENDDGTIGTESPKFQMRRHELMMQEIVPDVKVYSLLCFSNGKIIINGKENFADYPIVTIDQLEEKLIEICSTNLYTNEDIDSIVDDINKHKVNIQN